MSGQLLAMPKWLKTWAARGFPTIQKRKKKKKHAKTYNSEDSLVVTHPTTNSPACGLSTAERTGSPVFHTLWSYVLVQVRDRFIECNPRAMDGWISVL
ncbi:hypothetical protein N7519_006232 [Penicillium mononematosum]|uniref:uncharacterized protein n=1 Tax=Penicillium mononematosum TaxID=268346 RepID=UPI002549A2FB|nr:uncharacterized protein N7519_006232 [Penicillium mononematosum]KAJ6184931.1 hypothetical protein N7519_006232 [Penicillium mononematosum]